MPFIFVTYVIALATTFSTKLVRSRESRLICLAPNLNEKVINFSLLLMIAQIFPDVFYRIEGVLFYS